LADFKSWGAGHWLRFEARIQVLALLNFCPTMLNSNSHAQFISGIWEPALLMAKKNPGSDTHSADVGGSTTFEKFAKAFKTESYLRQNLAELFSRTPRIQGVQITHGQQEYGIRALMLGANLNSPLWDGGKNWGWTRHPTA
jgi:hypothetical protein